MKRIDGRKTENVWIRWKHRSQKEEKRFLRRRRSRRAQRLHLRAQRKNETDW